MIYQETLNLMELNFLGADGIKDPTEKYVVISSEAGNRDEVKFLQYIL